MLFLGLPWVIGPIPIVATVWAAYVCVITVAKKRGDSGEAFLAGLLLPSGLIAIACQLFLSDYNLTVLLISSQIISSACFLFILNASTSSRFFGASEAQSSASPPVFSRPFMILSAAFIIFNVFLWRFPGPNRCTIGKCFAMEWALGRIDRVFSRIYLETILGTIMLAGIVSHLLRLFLKVRRATDFRIK